MPPRLYTLAEAEAMLPRIQPILEAVRDAQATMTAAENDVARLLAPAGSNGHGVKAAEVQAAREAAARANTAMRQLAAELDELGIELKDPSTGLIDFRSRRQGRIVYLCWRLGEARIDWWHELDTGFAGRLSLERPD